MSRRAPMTLFSLGSLVSILATMACGGTSDGAASPSGDAGDARDTLDTRDTGDVGATVGYAPRWARSAGDGTSQLADGIAIASNGDVFLAGEFGGAMDFGDGVSLRATDGATANGFVVALDSSGRARWAKGFGGTKGGEQRVRVVAVNDAIGVVIGGFFSGEMTCGERTLVSAGGSDAFLVVLDEAGHVQACARYGDEEHQAVTSLALDPAGRIVVAGEFAGTLDLGGGPLVTAGVEDLFLATFDRDLGHVWSKRFGGLEDERLPRIARAESGAIAFAGIHQDTIDLGGGPFPARTDAGFVALFDAAGNHVYSHAFLGNRHESPIAVAFDAAGDVVVGGRFSGDVDFGNGLRSSASGEDAFVASWDPVGIPRWSVRFGGDGEDSVNGLALDDRDHIHLCGDFTTTFDALSAVGGPDAFVAELDPDGTLLFRAAYGDDDEQHAYRLALLDQVPVVVGSFFGAIDFGSAGRLRSAGGFDPSAGDLFVVRFSR